MVFGEVIECIVRVNGQEVENVSTFKIFSQCDDNGRNLKDEVPIGYSTH